jgi:hypothetical protein
LVGGLGNTDCYEEGIAANELIGEPSGVSGTRRGLELVAQVGQVTGLPGAAGPAPAWSFRFDLHESNAMQRAPRLAAFATAVPAYPRSGGNWEYWRDGALTTAADTWSASAHR